MEDEENESLRYCFAACWSCSAETRTCDVIVVEERESECDVDVVVLLFSVLLFDLRGNIRASSLMSRM